MASPNSIPIEMQNAKAVGVSVSLVMIAPIIEPTATPYNIPMLLYVLSPLSLLFLLIIIPATNGNLKTTIS